MKAPARMRPWLRRLSLMSGVIVVVAASVLVAWGLRRYLRQSPRFSVRTVEVEGNQRRTPHQIAKRAGIENGTNVFSIDEADAKAAVEADPWIATAEVSVELPSTVTIRVVEREARALSVIGGQLYLVDNFGDVFKEHVDGDPTDLPIVSGIDAEALRRDRESVTALIRRALDLVADLEQAKIAERYPIQEVNIAPDASVAVTIGSEGMRLVFGTPPFRNKVEKAGRILEELRYRNVKRATLFLDNKAHPERVVVRMK